MCLCCRYVCVRRRGALCGRSPLRVFKVPVNRVLRSVPQEETFQSVEAAVLRCSVCLAVRIHPTKSREAPVSVSYQSATKRLGVVTYAAVDFEREPDNVCCCRCVRPPVYDQLLALPSHQLCLVSASPAAGLCCHEQLYHGSYDKSCFADVCEASLHGA